MMKPQPDDDPMKLTEHGEARAVGLMGGQDVANVTAAFVQLLRGHGTVFGLPEPGPGNRENQERFEANVSSAWTYFVVQRVVYSLAEFGLRAHPSWRQLVEQMEDNFLAETDYFSHNPRAFTGDDRV